MSLKLGLRNKIRRSRSAGTGFTPLLDQSFATGATAAYSLRQLKFSATKAVRVREDSGNTETDIGFSGGTLDETALSNHCGSANGFVSRWYDQSGNGNDASNFTASAQPQIVSSGSIIKENGKPALDFDGSDDGLQLSKDISNTVSSYSFIMVLNHSGNDAFTIDIETGRFAINRPSLYLFFDGDGKGSSFSTNSQILGELFLEQNNNTGDGYENGSPHLTGLTYSPLKAEGETTIGSKFNFSDLFSKMQIQELIIYTSDRKADRGNFETNINGFYSIY